MYLEYNMNLSQMDAAIYNARKDQIGFLYDIFIIVFYSGNKRSVFILP